MSQRLYIARVLFAQTLLLITTLTTGAEGSQCVRSVEALTSFGMLVDPVLTLSASELRRPGQPSAHDQIVRRLPREQDFAMRYAMLRLTAQGEQQGEWFLTIRDVTSKVLASFGPNDFAAQQGIAPKSIWTGRLDASDIDFDLFVGDAKNSDLTLTVDESLMMPAGVDAGKARYSWRGLAPTYVPLYDSTLPIGTEAARAVRRLGDSVGFLIGMTRTDAGQMKSWCCSGVMLTDNVLLTNWHCGGWTDGVTENNVWSKDTCNTTFVDLSWDGDRASREFSCQSVIKTARQKELDYTLIKVAPVASEKPHRAGRPLRFGQQSVGKGDDLRIIHHAECKKKLVTLDCNVKEASRPGRRPIPGAPPSDFAHDCDTEGGSSGAPIFNANNELVGIHRAGHEKTTQDQCDDVNKAVHIQQILDDIKASQPSIFQEIKRHTKGLPD